MRHVIYLNYVVGGMLYIVCIGICKHVKSSEHSADHIECVTRKFFFEVKAVFIMYRVFSA